MAKSGYNNLPRVTELLSDRGFQPSQSDAKASALIYFIVGKSL